MAQNDQVMIIIKYDLMIINMVITWSFLDHNGLKRPKGIRLYLSI